MASAVGSVYISLGADTAEFDRGMQSARGALKGFGKDVATASGAAEGRIKSLASAVQQLTAAENRMGAGNSARRAQEIADYGAELDRLRAKFNPVFAASKAYEASLEELNMAHRVGAISVQEYDAALADINRRYQGVAIGAQAAEGAMIGAARASGMAQANARNLAFQLVDIGQSIPLAFQSPLYALQNLGFQMAQIGQIYAGQGGMKAALTDSVLMVGRFAGSAGPAIAGAAALGAAIAGMASEINETADVAVGFGDVVLASFQVIRDGIYSTIRPAVEDIAPWFETAWDTVQQGAIALGNAIINAMRIAAEGIAAAVSAIPDAFSKAFNGARAIVLSVLADMAGAVDRFVYAAVNAINSAFGTEFSVPTAAADAYASLNEMAGDALVSAQTAAAGSAAAWEDFRAKAAEIAASDPLGDFFGKVSTQAQANARNRLTAGAGGGGGGGGGRGRSAVDEAAREAERLQKAYDRMVASGEEFIAQQEMERQALGMSEEAANRLRHEFNFLNEAQRAGIILTPEQTMHLRQLAGQMAEAEARTVALQKAQDDAKEAQEEFNRAVADVSDRFSRAIQSADSFADALKNIGVELANLAVQGLAGEGPLGSVLGKLLPSLIGGAVGAFGGGVTGGTGATGTGFFSGAMMGGGGSLTFSANGNAFANGNLIPFARGGIVSRPTIFPMARGAGLMGEAGPEAILPLKRGPGGRLGVEAAGGNMVVNVYNYDGSPTETRERRTNTGKELDVIIGRKVAEQIGRGGSPVSRALDTRKSIVGR